MFLCTGILTAGSSTKNIVASRVTESPRIDGLLTDPAWQWAVPVAGFKQFDPEEGISPTEQTSVMMLYDNNALYVGVMCYDSEPNAIVRQLTRRDRTVQADRFSVIIDSYHDNTTALLFSGSASGVQSDGILSQDGLLYDVQWDAVWDFNAKVFDKGWSAEFKIPFSALRFSDQDSEYVWGINFRRYIARKKETDEWVMIPRKETPPGTISSVSKMGTLSGIRDIYPPLHIELLPYVVSNANYFAQPAPFSTRKEYRATAGLDLKYGVTNNFTLDMAFNPDFGQVEVDQSVLNLTVFETFYPEKRPFFLEGSQIFSFGNVFDGKELRLLYPRRIGKQPSGYDTLQVNSNQSFHEKPEITSILAAGKFSGKTDDGLSLGILSAVTDEENAVLEDINGNRTPKLTVEPRASYNVVRLKQDILEYSSVGMMATGSFKEQNFPSFTGGVDWNLRLNEGEYAIDGYLAGSQMKMTPGRTFSGSAGRIGIGKLNDEHFLGFTLYDFSTNNFRINDLGYYSQAREHGGYTQLTYKQDKAAFPVRRYAFSIQTDYRWNWDGINAKNEIQLEPSWEFRNFWLATLNYTRLLPAHDDLNRGIIGLYHRSSGNRISGTLQTDSRKPVVISAQTYYEDNKRGLGFFMSVLNVTLRPTTWIELTPGFTWAKTRNEEAWVYPVYISDPAIQPGAFNLFGNRDIDQYDISLRGIFTFTRTLSVQFFTQLLLAKGEYSNFKYLQDRNTLLTYDYVNYAGYFNPDFNEKTFNANVVLRWEYLPGSTFYLVWTQARYGDNGIFNRNFTQNLSDAFKLPMDNVLLAKISYWWSL